MRQKKIGEDIVIYDRKGNFNFEICRLRTVASTIQPKVSLPTLPVNPIPVPDLNKPEILHFIFEWAGALSPVDQQGKVKQEFWTINKRAWEGMKKDNMPEPLATLTLGKTYLINLHNATPHSHPIHLHGHTFTVINSDKRSITPYHTDTILL
ncbi:MAG: multicopper oxidase domain-containing protein [Spongiibacteraceae bacterium]|nr:multicopper oxidase domain-containing protein [Spongiibacteraceae bacterium]